MLIATRIRCDAIIVKTNGLQLLPLTKLNIRDVSYFQRVLHRNQESGGSVSQSEYHKDRAQALEWLWETIAEPVLAALGFESKPDDSFAWPRVWWIPTGALSQLPIHAAGLHSKHTNETVIDRVISSYSQSITTLIHTRRKKNRDYHFRGSRLLVSMVDTPGLASLPQAGREISEVAGLLSSVATTAAQIVTLEHPTKKEVLDNITNAHTIHFAGHAISHPQDPLRSYMALMDCQTDPLTVEDILTMKRREEDQRPFLAYLSACSTGQNLVQDLVDESMSLMSAFQLIGFRHTVANLWEMTDELLVRASTNFYKEMHLVGNITDETIAWCVHVTTRYLRNAAEHDPANFACWPAYVHSGP